MNRINKNGKKVKLDIEFIHSKADKELHEILKKGYLNYIKSLKANQ
jgi:hypothetical protein